MTEAEVEQPIPKVNRFAVDLNAPPPEEEVHVYSHGIPPERVEEIKRLKLELEKRVMDGGEPVTLQEFKDIVLPFQRIHRTEVFILNPVKVKPVRVPRVKTPKAPKEKVEKPVKVKTLTKKQLEVKLNELLFKKFTLGLTDEEEAFLALHTGDKII